jgi:ATP-dependent RNA helicase DDX18/HAS1
MNLRTYKFHKIIDCEKNNYWLYKLAKKNVLTKHTFENFTLSNLSMIRVLELSFTHLTKIQAVGIPLQICGFDILCSARTGSGKTLTFAVPMIELIHTLNWKIENGTAGIILSPTRELTLQNYYIFKDLLKYHKIKVGIFMGGANRKTEILKIKTGLAILTATPGRLLDHLKSCKELIVKNLQILVIDEADRCMEIGFENEMFEIFDLLPLNRQTIMLSATQTKNIKNLIDKSFKKKPVFFAVDSIRHISVPNIKQGFTVLNQEEKVGLLVSIIKKNKGRKIIVFFSSCNEVKFFSSLFRSIKITVQDLHGKQKQYKRTSVFFSFCNSKSSILFCTDIAARGLDFPMIDWIIQFSAPTDPKEYVHRIGRTGRGTTGKGYSLVFIFPSEIGFLRYLKKNGFILEEFRFPIHNILFLNSKISNLLKKNYFLSKLGKEAFQSFMSSYRNHFLKEIFDSTKLNVKRISVCYGVDVN